MTAVPLSLAPGTTPRRPTSIIEAIDPEKDVDGLHLINAGALLAGDWTADQRMAAFLIGLSRRLAARGFSPHRFQLTMARTDIGNYLRLAPETVSRVLRRFQKDGLLAIDRRDVELLDPQRLEDLAEPLLER